MAEENQKVSLSGTVVFLCANKGSKSEALMPFLYQGRALPPQKILLKGDNPFENKGLCAYDGARVELVGAIAPSGTFVVEQVTSL